MPPLHPLTVTLLLACSGPGSVLTEPEASPPRLLMSTIDSDGDGKLSPDEFSSTAHPSRSFEDHDLDRDGFIDPTELRVLLQRVSPLLPDYRGAGTFEGAPAQPRPAHDHQPPAPVPPPPPHPPGPGPAPAQPRG
jgi:hypothetical protein